MGASIQKNFIVPTDNAGFEKVSLNTVLAALHSNQDANDGNNKAKDQSQQHDQQPPAADEKVPPNEGDKEEKADKEDKEEKAAKDGEETDKPPVTAEELQQLPQAEADGGEDIQREAAALNITVQQLLKLFEQDGNISDLIYNLYGEPYIVQSVPRGLGIPPFPPELQKVYIPVENPPAPIVESNPCCVVPIEINVTNVNYIYQGEGEFALIISTQENTSLESYLSSLYTFTFNGCSTCESDSSEGGSQIDFTVPNGNEGFSSGIISIPSYYDVNCDCPITSLEIVLNINSSSPVSESYFNSIFGSEFDDLSGFSYGGFEIGGGYAQVFFLSACGDEFQLVSGGGTGWELQQVGQTEPIIFDLNGDGIHLSSASTSDVILNNNGALERTGWIDSSDGILTYGYSGEGAIEHKNFALTENVDGAKTDLDALQALAKQSGGILDGNNPIWDNLGMWQDGNHNGAMDKGEYQTLTQLGISSISLTQTGTAHLENGNVVYGNLSFTYADGKVGYAENVGLRYEDVIQSNSSIPNLPSETSTSSPSSSVPVNASSAPVAEPVAPPHVDPTVQSAIDTTQQQPVAVAA